jgi:hypothetical protein
VRTDRLLCESVSRWSRESRARRRREQAGEARVEGHREAWLRQRAKNVFSYLSEQVDRSQLQRRLERKCKRHLFRTFRRRITESVCVHDEVAARISDADSYYQKSLLQLGVRFLMFRVQMKYHRQHAAYLETREYHRAQLRAAVRHLHRQTRRAHRHRQLRRALHTHCATQQKRRVLQALDGAVVRRWGRRKAARFTEQDVAVRRLHRGFQRLVRHCHRKRLGLHEEQ